MEKVIYQGMTCGECYLWCPYRRGLGSFCYREYLGFHPFPNEEKEALERKIRYLEGIIKTLERKSSESRRFHLDRINSLESQNRRLLAEVDDLKSQVSSLTTENESNLKRAEIAEKEVAILNGTNKKLEKKVKKLEKENKRLEKKFNELINSNSWKLTYNLRKLRKKI